MAVVMARVLLYSHTNSTVWRNQKKKNNEHSIEEQLPVAPTGHADGHVSVPTG